jgi:hypothetical protein
MRLLALLVICVTAPGAVAGRPSSTPDRVGEEMAAEPQPHIPARFRGEWNEKLENCGTGIDHARFRIEADRIGYYESGGAVLAAVTRGESELAVIADMSGEGMSWLGLMRFRLSEDQACLTELTASDAATGREAALLRCRCPPTPR